MIAIYLLAQGLFKRVNALLLPNFITDPFSYSTDTSSGAYIVLPCIAGK